MNGYAMPQGMPQYGGALESCLDLSSAGSFEMYQGQQQQAPQAPQAQMPPMPPGTSLKDA